MLCAVNEWFHDRSEYAPPGLFLLTFSVSNKLLFYLTISNVQNDAKITEILLLVFYDVPFQKYRKEP